MNVAVECRPVRLEAEVRGVVQGLGFRPHIHRLATGLGLAGWVQNTAQGVSLLLEGDPATLNDFLRRLAAEAPAHAVIEAVEAKWSNATGLVGFEIRDSATTGSLTAQMLPDLAICGECVREVFDPANRRHRHPFINCTHCGPRFSIIESLPYDRSGTSMRIFPQCAACRAEYENPADRRFHAQPNACPDCGPQLALWNPDGSVTATRDEALRMAAEAVRAGQIVAVKGLGGFHLMVAADQPAAVARLRQRKGREEKPFAIMLPSLAGVRAMCEVSALEERLLASPEAPIVLLRRCASGPTLDGVAPGNPHLGVLLPSTALHHLLLREIGGSVVATSGNLRDEPICIDEHEALTRLAAVADLFLVHDRPIVRAVDDSIVRVVADRPLILRRARGHAPRAVDVERVKTAEDADNTGEQRGILAVGGQQKNTVALAVGNRVFLSQHIGDLETTLALEAHGRAVHDLQTMRQVRAELVVTDLHSGYASTQAAAGLRLPRITVQHHQAHLLSCLADNAVAPPALGVIWDGTGDGGDGTIWGGEFLVTRTFGPEFERVGSFRTFPLPGGEAAIREPRRAALGLLFELFGEEVWSMTDLPTLGAFTATELGALRRMLERRVNTPRTSSVGRLFDAMSSLLGLRQISRFEGQAAMELEFAAEAAGLQPADGRRDTVGSDGRFAICDLRVGESKAAHPAARTVDWGALVSGLIQAQRGGVLREVLAGRFHEALAECVVPIALQTGLEKVALSGGCFQNRRLTELVIERLRAAGFRPLWHRHVPPNDGGLALGQAWIALAGAR